MCEERDEAHEFSEDQGILHKVKRVVDTERVKNRCQEHGFANECRKASTFDIWLA